MVYADDCICGGKKKDGDMRRSLSALLCLQPRKGRERAPVTVCASRTVTRSRPAVTSASLTENERADRIRRGEKSFFHYNHPFTFFLTFLSDERSRAHV